MIKAIVIDDEKLARDVIVKFLENHDQIELVAQCINGFEGVKAISEHQPQLIFLDVQMPKLTGFEMLELIDEKPVIIFSTAYDQYAIKAFEQNAADYLLKPYAKTRFDEAIEKALSKIKNQQTDEEVISKVVNNQVTNESLDRIVIKNGTKILIIGIDEINYFEAQDDYVAVHSQGKKYLKQFTMKHLTDKLPADKFVRVHRSFIVAINQIDKLEAYSKDSYLAILKTGEKISVSRNGYNELRERLNF
jgi:two-component system, LytTR family, response regulator